MFRGTTGKKRRVRRTGRRWEDGDGRAKRTEIEQMPLERRQFARFHHLLYDIGARAVYKQKNTSFIGR